MGDDAPIFEATDIFAGFTPLPPAPQKPAPPEDDEWGPPEYDEEPPDFEDDVRAMMEMEQEESMRRDVLSLDKGNSDDERKRDEAARRRRAAIAASLSQASPPKTVASSSVPMFEPSDIFAAGPSTSSSSSMFEPLGIFGDGPIESSTRAPRTHLTPPPELDASMDVYDEVGRLLLPIEAETASGETIRFKRRNKPRAPVDLAQSTVENPVDLLTTPLYRLLQEVDELKSQQKALELERQFAAEGRPKGKAPASNLWVDKYRPKKFADLLGEDRVHREVLGWLKEWDKCVFKRIPPKKRKAREDDGVSIYHDPLGRPRERVLLLSGPPGFGKTTLAHIVANHAGYRTLEINASDDRNAATVSTRIKNAIDAGSGLDSGGKPTCVVIDEIDGATGGGDTSFVRQLIKLIQDQPARKKTNTPAKPLRRPIICICNDLYATSLRPLRPFARIVRFRKAPSQFLVARLREICEREKLTADLRVLSTLVDLTQGDVRSCINTLQFIKSKSTVVTDEAIKSTAVGSKDSGSTLQETWNNLFVPVAAKQRRKVAGAIDDGRYVDRLAAIVSACSGEHDRVVQGCFEHYTNLKPYDASFANLNRLHNWVAYYDSLNAKISENMEFELLAYVPYAVVPWYSHMAAPANATRPAEWPKADYESYLARTANGEIATSLAGTLPPILHSLFSPKTTLTELIPLLMRVISPPLKPVNANIVKQAEKATLARLVQLMIPLGLRFEQEKTEDGQPMMRLEPAIDVFVHYDGKRAGDIAAGRFAVRQLVAQAMETELARRRGLASGGGASSTAQHLSEQYGVAKTGNKAAAAEAKPAAAATDFFGRVKAVPTEKHSSAISNGHAHVAAPLHPTKRFRAVYKYNEGSSSAVRKNIKMSTLM